MRNSICNLDSSWLRSIVFAQSGMSSGWPGGLAPARYSVPDRVAIPSQLASMIVAGDRRALIPKI